MQVRLHLSSVGPGGDIVDFREIVHISDIKVAEVLLDETI